MTNHAGNIHQWSSRTTHHALVPSSDLEGLADQELADLSFGMLALLASGLSLWVTYGFLQSDRVIIASSVVAVALLVSLGAIEVSARR